MPTELEIRQMLLATDVPAVQLADFSHMIRVSRRRRLPKQALVGAVTGAAVVSLGTAGRTGFLRQQTAPNLPAAKALPAPTSSQTPPSHGGKRLPADQLQRCGSAVLHPAASRLGLVLTTEFPSVVSRTAGSVDGYVVLTNTSSATVSGYVLGAPTVTFAEGGITRWHSFAGSDPKRIGIELKPGRSYRFATTFSPVVCSSSDEEQGGRSDLPAAPAGRYELSAAVDFLGDFGADLVTGPSAEVTVR
jgi:hypothetical protein